MLSALLLARTRGPRPQKHRSSEQISEIVKESGVGECVDPNVREEAAEQAEKDQEAVYQPWEEPRQIGSAWRWLMGTRGCEYSND